MLYYLCLFFIVRDSRMALLRWLRLLFGRKRFPSSSGARFARTLTLEYLESRVVPSVDIRIVSYNIAGDARSGLGTVLQAIGNEVYNGNARQIDILALQETDSQATDTQAVVNLLNGIYGSGAYARGSVNGASTGAGTQGIVYRTSTVQLLEEVALPTAVGGTDPARQPLRYKLQPIGFPPSDDFYLYDSHYKAGDAASDIAQRQSEATAIRNNSNALGQGTNIIYVGDFNIYTSSESWYSSTLLGSGNGQGFDPINMPGSWDNNSSFAGIDT
jgi:endonuclease/exonuclease/phosphatase family metal-dependent hydrolase